MSEDAKKVALRISKKIVLEKQGGPDVSEGSAIASTQAILSLHDPAADRVKAGQQTPRVNLALQSFFDDLHRQAVDRLRPRKPTFDDVLRPLLGSSEEDPYCGEHSVPTVDDVFIDGHARLCWKDTKGAPHSRARSSLRRYYGRAKNKIRSS
jgi:hypothetical protein